MKSLFHVTLLLIVVSTAGARLYGVQLSIHNGSFGTYHSACPVSRSTDRSDLVEINEEAQNTTFILSITKKADPLTYEPVAVSDSAAGLLHVAIPMVLPAPLLLFSLIRHILKIRITSFRLIQKPSAS